MKITQEAKAIINSIFAEKKFNCIRTSLQKSCCGDSLVISLSKLKSDDKPLDINGISVLMDDKAQLRAEKVTIEVENGELFIKDETVHSCCK